MTTSNIRAYEGDITLAKTDALVNAANPSLLGGGGVDGAIHKAAGPSLLDECRKVKAVNGVRCPYGEARITNAGDLDAKYVIHTVGPIYSSDKNPDKTLASAYRNSLELAIKYNCQSIVFPAISCGAYGFPVEQAAKIAISECSYPEFKEMKIEFCLFSTDLYELWVRQLSAE